jgi:hypothetical protein
MTKRKLTEEQVANIFVDTTFETVENGWPEVAEFLNECPGFEQSPGLDTEDYGRFLMIIVLANIQMIPKHFDSGVDRQIIQRICSKFARSLDISPESFARKVKQYRAFMKQINRPSKNVGTAMTRAVFYKYHLNQYQNAYFRDMNAPEPNIQRDLKRLMEHFLWDWDAFTESYRVVSERI